MPNGLVKHLIGNCIYIRLRYFDVAAEFSH